MSRTGKRFKVGDNVKYIGPLRCEWKGEVIDIRKGEVIVRWWSRPIDIGWNFYPEELERLKK